MKELDEHSSLSRIMFERTQQVYSHHHHLQLVLCSNQRTLSLLHQMQPRMLELSNWHRKGFLRFLN